MQATDARRRISTAVALFNAAASARMTTHSWLNTGGVAMKRKVGVDVGWCWLVFVFCGEWRASGDSSLLASPWAVGGSTLPHVGEHVLS